MHIAVCIKQVPSSSEVRMDPVTNTIIRDSRQSVINPFDRYAVEEAIRIKEKLGAKVTVVSMGIPATERLLRDAICQGADDAILLSDRAFAGADTLATSYTLSLGMRIIGNVNLILCGKMAIDGDTAQIGPELAEQLSVPHVTDVCELLEVTEKFVVCRRNRDYGQEVVRVMLPALLTVAKDINVPRLPSIAGIRRSQTADFRIFNAELVCADPCMVGLNGSPTQVERTFVPERAKRCMFLDGSLEEKIGAVMQIM